MMQRFYNLFLFLCVGLVGFYSIGGVGVGRLPAGTGVISFGSTCPIYSVEASGASLLRAGQYSNLFAALGGASSPWGLPDGSHFTSPPLRDRSVRGAGSATDGHGGDAATLGAYQADATAANGLMYHDTGHAHGPGSPGNQFVVQGFAGSAFSGGGNGGNVSTTATASANISVSAQDNETRPKSYGVLFCVYY